MRTFTCFTTEDGSDVPNLVFVFASDADRARELARRELADAKRPAKVEVYEDGALLFVEHATTDELGGRPGAKKWPRADGSGSGWPRINGGSGGKPDAVNGFINGQKIWRYGESLAMEGDPERRPVLQSLLIREENRYGAYSEKLDTTQGFIADLGERIAAQRERIDRLRALGGDTAMAHQVLQQFERTSEIFTAFAEQIQRELRTVSL